MAKFPKTGLLRDVTWSRWMSCRVITEQLISKAELLGGFASGDGTSLKVHSRLQAVSTKSVATHRGFPTRGNQYYARVSRCRHYQAHRSGYGRDPLPFSSWLPSWVFGTINTHSLPFRVGLSVRSTPTQCPSPVGLSVRSTPVQSTTRCSWL